MRGSSSHLPGRWPKGSPRWSLPPKQVWSSGQTKWKWAEGRRTGGDESQRQQRGWSHSRKKEELGIHPCICVINFLKKYLQSVPVVYENWKSLLIGTSCRAVLCPRCCLRGFIHAVSSQTHDTVVCEGLFLFSEKKTEARREVVNLRLQNLELQKFGGSSPGSHFLKLFESSELREHFQKRGVDKNSAF